ncbi:MAG: IS3 family transposase [Erysipelotrichaceae bacterium]|nr:IS3 family transposase [Erysipelotrichaceae bacterium]
MVILFPTLLAILILALLELRAYCKTRIHKKIECLSFKKREPKKEEIAQVISELRQELKVSLNFILDEIHKDTSLPQITRSDYYYTINKPDKDLKNDDLMNEIIDIYYHHEKRYGYRRVTLELIRRGIQANNKKVRRLMSRMNLQGLKRHKRKYSSYKGEIGKVAPNIIQRKFFSDVPNKKWYTDITEFNLRGDKLYLSPILDGCAGDIVSYRLSRNPNLNQVIDMANEAITKNYTNGLIFHSDQGWQYQHSYYQKLLKDNGIIQSMSRKGNSIDDGLMENFFGLLKTEMFYEQEYKYKDLNDLSKAIDDYIYYYNNDRIKSRLKGLTPIEYRNQALMRTV